MLDECPFKFLKYGITLQKCADIQVAHGAQQLGANKNMYEF